jgi:hypothetical protein
MLGNRDSIVGSSNTVLAWYTYGLCDNSYSTDPPKGCTRTRTRIIRNLLVQVSCDILLQRSKLEFPDLPFVP